MFIQSYRTEPTPYVAPPPPAPVGAPYPWFPALDLSEIPFHVGSGPWGAQTPVQAPTAPTVAIDVTVSSLAALTAACNLGNRRITINGSFAGGQVTGTATDCDIIVLPAVTISGSLLFNTSQRFRIRGETVGALSGGTVRTLAFGGGAGWTDVIVDGLNLMGNAQENNGAQVIINYDGITRMAIVNNRMNGGGCGYLGVTRHLVIAGNSFNTGAQSGVGVGERIEAWSIRDGGAGPIVVAYNDIRSARQTAGQQSYHRFRTAPPDNNQLSWVAHNVLLDFAESRIWWINTYSGSAAGRAAGAWFVKNYVYTNNGGLSIQSGAGGPGSTGSGDNISSASYVRVTENTVYGPFTNSDIDIDGTGLVDGDKTTPANTFLPFAAAPSWTAYPGIGAGDPTSITIV